MSSYISCYSKVIMDREQEFEALKKRKSYLGRIPSKDFWNEAYELFLEFASPEELETDTLTRDTLEKISDALGYNKPILKCSNSNT